MKKLILPVLVFSFVGASFAGVKTDDKKKDKSKKITTPVVMKEKDLSKQKEMQNAFRIPKENKRISNTNQINK